MTTSYHQIDRDFTLDTIAPLGRVGLLCLATDYNIEWELPRLLPDGIGVYVNRVRNRNPMTVANLAAMRDDIARAATDILPELGVDLMIYACTSGAATIGEAVIAERIHRAWPGIPVTNPASAAIAALEHLAARRISIVTPYIPEINKQLVELFSSRGVEVLTIAGFGFDSDIDATGIPPSELTRAALRTVDERCEALFISCTALRASLAIDDLEAQLGIPVIASNQALAWHAQTLLGIEPITAGCGRLMRGNGAP